MNVPQHIAINFRQEMADGESKGDAAKLRTQHREAKMWRKSVKRHGVWELNI